MIPTNVSPTLCPECGHRFRPDAPEPSRCPDCGREWTGYGEAVEIKLPIPDEMPVTPEERRRWRTGFFAFFLIGPLFALALMNFKWDIIQSLPVSLREYAEATSHPILPLCISATGAGFCLANVWFARRRFTDKLAYSFLVGVGVMALYWVIAVTFALAFQ